MSNIYVLGYKYNTSDLFPGILTFTNKKTAIEWARYYHYSMQCEFVALRHDKKGADGKCEIVGFIEFYK